MPQISVHGLDAYYRDEGRGIPVVLGHSSTGSGGQWRDLFKRMSGRYRLLTSPWFRLLFFVGCAMSGYFLVRLM